MTASKHNRITLPDVSRLAICACYSTIILCLLTVPTGQYQVRPNVDTALQVQSRLPSRVHAARWGDRKIQVNAAFKEHPWSSEQTLDQKTTDDTAEGSKFENERVRHEQPAVKAFGAFTDKAKTASSQVSDDSRLHDSSNQNLLRNTLRVLKKRYKNAAQRRNSSSRKHSLQQNQEVSLTAADFSDHITGEHISTQNADERSTMETDGDYIESSAANEAESYPLIIDQYIGEGDKYTVDAPRERTGDVRDEESVLDSGRYIDESPRYYLGAAVTDIHPQNTFNEPALKKFANSGFSNRRLLILKSKARRKHKETANRRKIKAHPLKKPLILKQDDDGSRLDNEVDSLYRLLALKEAASDGQIRDIPAHQRPGNDYETAIEEENHERKNRSGEKNKVRTKEVNFSDRLRHSLYSGKVAYNVDNESQESQTSSTNDEVPSRSWKIFSSKSQLSSENVGNDQNSDEENAETYGGNFGHARSNENWKTNASSNTSNFSDFSASEKLLELLVQETGASEHHPTLSLQPESSEAFTKENNILRRRHGRFDGDAFSYAGSIRNSFNSPPARRNELAEKLAEYMRSHYPPEVIKAFIHRTHRDVQQTPIHDNLSGRLSDEATVIDSDGTLRSLSLSSIVNLAMLQLEDALLSDGRVQGAYLPPDRSPPSPPPTLSSISLPASPRPSPQPPHSSAEFPVYRDSDSERDPFPTSISSSYLTPQSLENTNHDQSSYSFLETDKNHRQRVPSRRRPSRPLINPSPLQSRPSQSWLTHAENGVPLGLPQAEALTQHGSDHLSENWQEPDYEKESFSNNSALWSNVPGIPGEDYPVLTAVPVTDFSCNGKVHGLYADYQAQCQVWHNCHENGHDSFLCVAGTLFNPQSRTCDWWYNVDCTYVTYPPY